jgi:hypothetical protein
MFSLHFLAPPDKFSQLCTESAPSEIWNMYKI